MNYFTTSTGERISKQQIDRNVRKAKEQKLAEHLDKYGYYFCTICFRNDCKPIDCAHMESVDSCQKNGYVDKAWSLDNIVLAGRKCHQEHDRNNVMNVKIAI